MQNKVIGLIRMTKMRGIWQVFQQCHVSRWNGTEELTSCIARSGRERKQKQKQLLEGGFISSAVENG
jgi:hypothetical protein